MATYADAKQITRHAADDWSAAFDGQYIGSFTTRDAAQRALDDHAMRLIEDGLIDLPLTLLDTQACLVCGAIQARASCDACVEWNDGAVPPEQDGYDDVPAGPGEPSYHLTRAQLTKALDGAIEMFLEYQYQHGYGEMEARQRGVDEVLQGLDADRELVAFDPNERLRLQLPGLYEATDASCESYASLL